MRWIKKVVIALIIFSMINAYITSFVQRQKMVAYENEFADKIYSRLLSRLDD